MFPPFFYAGGQSPGIDIHVKFSLAAVLLDGIKKITTGRRFFYSFISKQAFLSLLKICRFKFGIDL